MRLIHAQLIAIMGDHLSAHIKSLNTIRWDALSAKPCTNEHTELLVKETATLHKVLSHYLASALVKVCQGMDR
jgi:vacuolar protein sorting-associated protein 54